MPSSPPTEDAIPRKAGTEVETGIRALLEAWASAIRDEEMVRLLVPHADDIVLFDVPSSLQSRGIDAYQKAWDLFFAMQGKGAFDRSELEITGGDRVAFCHSIVTGGSADPAGQFKVHLTVGRRKENDDWIVAHEHRSAPAE